jgi:hypothetical protein
MGAGQPSLSLFRALPPGEPQLPEREEAPIPVGRRGRLLVRLEGLDRPRGHQAIQECDDLRSRGGAEVFVFVQPLCDLFQRARPSQEVREQVAPIGGLPDPQSPAGRDPEV